MRTFSDFLDKSAYLLWIFSKKVRTFWDFLEESAYLFGFSRGKCVPFRIFSKKVRTFSDFLEESAYLFGFSRRKCVPFRIFSKKVRTFFHKGLQILVYLVFLYPRYRFTRSSVVEPLAAPDERINRYFTFLKTYYFFTDFFNRIIYEEGTPLAGCFDIGKATSGERMLT
jgi:hypothetical protein